MGNFGWFLVCNWIAGFAIFVLAWIITGIINIRKYGQDIVHKVMTTPEDTGTTPMQTMMILMIVFCLWQLAFPVVIPEVIKSFNEDCKRLHDMTNGVS